ncbi:hypothetical protein PVAND_007683 [Polypedilum vanderplanki]|uniref:Serine protease K12H4.7 n=1 Tax=Polypedilum vanderplanki TaxID=319348 RepID=A0A9J6C846_POLVA|nr:hypothetical protein PVAND_007683 [Polypedilum vanderplanki]
MKKLFVIVLLICEVYGWTAFWRGRKYGGNIVDPEKIANRNFISLRDITSDNWLTQKLDHFDFLNTKTWKQRYYVSAQYYKPNGPIFLMIGGEGEAISAWMKKGAWITYAQRFGSLCFMVEHRFYGKSHPTNDISTTSLSFLSSEQALADLAYFVTAMNSQYNLTADDKWIAFGGSYAGSLAAWLRKKFSHLIYGAVASSSPLLAKVEYPDYLKIVQDELANYDGCDCVNEVQIAINKIDSIMKVQNGPQSMSKHFKFCGTFSGTFSNLDISTIYESIANIFAGVVQNNFGVTVHDVCGIMCNMSIIPATLRLVEANSIVMKAYGQNCFQYNYNQMIDYLKVSSWSSDSSEGSRQWLYQTCSEFGFYQTSSNSSSIFGDRISIQYFMQLCIDVFGSNFNFNSLTNAVNRTNVMYGGLYPETTNVIYVQGSMDPWHALGLTQTNSIQPQPTIYIDGTSHCADVYPPSKKDPPELTAARVKIVKFLSKLLN